MEDLKCPSCKGLKYKVMGYNEIPPSEIREPCFNCSGTGTVLEEKRNPCSTTPTYGIPSEARCTKCGFRNDEHEESEEVVEEIDYGKLADEYKLGYLVFDKFFHATQSKQDKHGNYLNSDVHELRVDFKNWYNDNYLPLQKERCTLIELGNSLYDIFDIPMLDVAGPVQVIEHAINYLKEYKWKRR